MHWLIKAHAMALLSRLPGGKSVYHSLQRRLGTNRLNFAESLERTGQIVDLVRETGCDVCGATCLEIGTGWRPFVPMLLYLAGAERTITLDINPWMDQRYAVETYRAIGKGLPQIAERLHVSQSQIESRYVRIDESKLNLANLLAAFHVDYRCPADACATGLPSRLIDYVVSSNVLEHVPPAVLEGMHRESADPEARRVSSSPDQPGGPLCSCGCKNYGRQFPTISRETMVLVRRQRAQLSQPLAVRSTKGVIGGVRLESRDRGRPFRRAGQ